MTAVADIAVAVVGAGVHGSRYAEHLLRGEVPGVRLAGVCRRSGADAARWTSRGVRFETDAGALAGDPSVDAVVVASPPLHHEEHAAAVLAAGKPLLLEKPVAPDGAACARIAAAASRAGVPVLVGHSLRYNPVVRALREEIRRAGDLRHLGLSQRHERMPQEWQNRPPAGGALLSVSGHAADLARGLAGREIAAGERCLLEPAPGVGAEGAAAALCRLEGGATLFVEVSITAPGRRTFAEARTGADGFEGDILHGTLARLRGRAREAVPVAKPGPGLVPLLADFAAAARGRPSGDAATLADGIAAVAFTEACRRAAR